ncbi:hypothetical protein EV363DRAFT_1156610 [Boletus edulis]|uniref:Uncharacterized protein n=1 Tax=Boletus edulis BED1 TaxID=1328754 RepID=A0AAD4GDR1_BOLED|nr:hypothetical protein EV363DRAFT_1156610 [Boletus edulis]KAF8438836.1 hypothetical protein L210DRAFT_2229524 [Boletus edulis BED1]
MACVGTKKQNSFSPLDTLSPPPPNQSSRAQHQRNPLKKGPVQDSSPIAVKSQQNGDQRYDQRKQPNAARPNARKKSNVPSVCISLSSLQLPDARIGSRHEIGITPSVKTKDPGFAPPRYHPDFRTNQSMLE